MHHSCRGGRGLRAVGREPRWFCVGLGVLCFDFKVMQPASSPVMHEAHQPQLGQFHRKFLGGMWCWAKEDQHLFCRFGCKLQRTKELDEARAGLGGQLNSWHLCSPARGWEQLGANTVTYALALKIRWEMLVTGAYYHLRYIFEERETTKLHLNFPQWKKWHPFKTK